VSDRAIVFGASGALGSAVCLRLEVDQVDVVRVTRQATERPGWLSMSESDWADHLGARSVNRIIWAHGLNAEGSITDSGVEQLQTLFEANVLFIARTLRTLLDRDVLTSPARLVIVSSVWQNSARDRKLAYVTTKAALAGLVRSLVADLGPSGVSVNAVLPGVVDTPMTREFLTLDQIHGLERDTPTGSLVTGDEVANACAWLSSRMSSGVNGQFVSVDGGWSDVRHV
jgi:3-oxoacyl-[acyl-carrier protein] reductase